MIKQKEKLTSEFQQLKKEKDDAAKAQKEFEEWKQDKKRKVRTQMEGYLKQNKENTKVEENERREINGFFKTL